MKLRMWRISVESASYVNSGITLERHIYLWVWKWYLVCLLDFHHQCLLPNVSNSFRYRARLAAALLRTKARTFCESEVVTLTSLSKTIQSMQYSRFSILFRKNSSSSFEPFNLLPSVLGEKQVHLCLSKSLRWIMEAKPVRRFSNFLKAHYFWIYVSILL